ncbi:MAG: gamma-glutamylcyclotransferase [Tagaea sp.]|nr:gamma-glutamylcyclotransferase [Tagaea sp.]
MDALPFFFYGTLMDAGVRRAVLGGKAPKRLEPGVLLGWRRFLAVGASFPIVAADGRGRVRGVLAHDVCDAARALLDAYEGPDGYRAERWIVEREDGGRLKAMVYVPDGSGSVRASKAPWDLVEWQATHKTAFLAKLKKAKTAPRG